MVSEIISTWAALFDFFREIRIIILLIVLDNLGSSITVDSFITVIASKDESQGTVSAQCVNSFLARCSIRIRNLKSNVDILVERLSRVFKSVANVADKYPVTH